ncbi:hypothetical protein D3C85_1575400 [compost metagenome]
MPDLNWWQSILVLIAFFTVTGWAGAMHQQAKRTADLLEQIATQLNLDRMDRSDRD